MSTIATIRLVEEGFKNVFLCTGDDMLAAIKVYLSIGYTPCLYASDQKSRWSDICHKIGLSYTPDEWPTPEEYIRGNNLG